MAKEKVYTHSTQWILDQVINDSTVAASFQTKIDLARSTFESSLILNHANGIFKADQLLISQAYANSMIYKTGSFYLLDHRGIPVKIPNAKEFLKIVVEIYNSAASCYYDTMIEILEKRSQEV